jgi:hypothetical protein
MRESGHAGGPNSPLTNMVCVKLWLRGFFVSRSGCCETKVFGEDGVLPLPLRRYGRPEMAVLVLLG